MGHAIRFQDIEVSGIKKIVVANLDGIVQMARQATKEHVEIISKGLRLWIAGFGERPKFNQENADPVQVRLERSKKSNAKSIGI